MEKGWEEREWEEEEDEEKDAGKRAGRRRIRGWKGLGDGEETGQSHSSETLRTGHILPPKVSVWHLGSKKSKGGRGYRKRENVL